MIDGKAILLVAGGGALGAVFRYGIVVAAAAICGTRFPYGTLVVNALGCFCVGWAAAALESETLSVNLAVWLRQGFIVGFLGALTTFSAFGLDTYKLQSDRQFLLAAGNILANLVVGFGLVWLGLRIGRASW